MSRLEVQIQLSSSQSPIQSPTCLVLSYQCWQTRFGGGQGATPRCLSCAPRWRLSAGFCFASWRRCKLLEIHLSPHDTSAGRPCGVRGGLEDVTRVCGRVWPRGNRAQSLSEPVTACARGESGLGPQLQGWVAVRHTHCRRRAQRRLKFKYRVQIRPHQYRIVIFAHVQA